MCFWCRIKLNGKFLIKCFSFSLKLVPVENILYLIYAWPTSHISKGKWLNINDVNWVAYWFQRKFNWKWLFKDFKSSELKDLMTNCCVHCEDGVRLMLDLTRKMNSSKLKTCKKNLCRVIKQSLWKWLWMVIKDRQWMKHHLVEEKRMWALIYSLKRSNIWSRVMWMKLLFNLKT